MTYLKSTLANLRFAEEGDKWDPPTLFSAVSGDVVELTTGLARTFGSAGQAW